MLGRGAVSLPRAEDGAGEFRFVGRIGIVLGFETEGVVLLVTAAPGTAVKEVGTVKLHSRLGRVDLHHAAAGGLLHSSGELELALLTAEDEAMVVAFRLVRVLFQFADSLADGMWCGEIERCAFDRGQFASGN